MSIDRRFHYFPSADYIFHDIYLNIPTSNYLKQYIPSIDYVF